MISKRDALITLEAAAGLKTYEQIGFEFGIGVARVGQIVTKTLGELRLTRKLDFPKERIGNALQRRFNRYRDYQDRLAEFYGDTPETFYFNELVPGRAAREH